MKIMIEASAKEIADLISQLQGQPIEAKSTNNPIEIFVLKEKIDNKDMYKWGWQECWDKKVFGLASSLNEIKIRAARMLKTEDVVLCIL